MFALGTELSGEISNETLIESDTYHDLLIIDMIDSYSNLTIKTIATLRWASIYCTKAVVLYNVGIRS
ncbi:unnamed protein product [Anisakis simplex]|uniref:Hexosyltransferase n=1 Tax=Anisakis simplex TaxID=6269 RepID=A0A0M3K276_ANISI|nr:unnamed protein product [Anisakis simplex]